MALFRNDKLKGVLEFNIDHKPNKRVFKIENTFLEEDAVGVDEVLIKETTYFRAKKRIQFLRASSDNTREQALINNNFTRASEFVDKEFLEGDDTKQKLDKLYLHNYDNKNKDSYAPLIIEECFPKTKFGKQIEMRK